MKSVQTDDWRSHDWSDSLEEQKESECVGQFVQTEKVDKDNRRQTDVSARRDAEDGAEDCLNKFQEKKFIKFDLNCKCRFKWIDFFRPHTITLQYLQDW